jgi:plasmid maintenance system antidote protein VapI
MMSRSWHTLLQNAMDEAGHKHRDAAEEIGVQVSTIESWVQGRRGMPARQNMPPVAQYIHKYTGATVPWGPDYES